MRTFDGRQLTAAMHEGLVTGKNPYECERKVITQTAWRWHFPRLDGRAARGCGEERARRD